MKRIKNFIYKFWIPIILVGVLVGGSLFESVDYKTNGPWIKVREGAFVSTVLGTDTIFTNLTDIDSVRFMGYYGDSYQSGYLVETPSGIRGKLPVWMADISILIASGDYKGESATLSVPTKIRRDKYGVRIPNSEKLNALLSDGQQIEISEGTDIFPEIPHFGKYKIHEWHSFSKVMSIKKFMRLTKNLDFSRASGLIGPMSGIAYNPDDQLTASFRTYVFNPDNGKFYQPTVSFGKDSISATTQLTEISDRGSWFLKYLPGVSAIYDFPPTSFFARSAIYDNYEYNSLMSVFEKTVFWIMWLMTAIGSLLWLVAIGILPLWVFDYTLYAHPDVLKPFPNWSLRIIYIILMAICYYYWCVVLFAWGAYWWIVPIIIGFALGVYEFFASVFDDDIPHARCPECRHAGTIVLIDRNLMDTKTKTENNSSTYKLSEYTKRWKTWTQVTQGDRTWKENEQDHFETITQWRNDEYREKVRYDYSMLHYKCMNCGYRERKSKTDRKVLHSEHLGSKKWTEKESSEY